MIRLKNMTAATGLNPRRRGPNGSDGAGEALSGAQRSPTIKELPERLSWKWLLDGWNPAVYIYNQLAWLTHCSLAHAILNGQPMTTPTGTGWGCPKLCCFGNGATSRCGPNIHHIWPSFHEHPTFHIEQCYIVGPDVKSKDKKAMVKPHATHTHTKHIKICESSGSSLRKQVFLILYWNETFSHMEPLDHIVGTCFSHDTSSMTSSNNLTSPSVAGEF